jgi:hypothetical protein
MLIRIDSLHTSTIVVYHQGRVLFFRSRRDNTFTAMPSCLPMMLLGSVPLTLQADVADPGFSDLAKEQRSATGVTPRNVVVDSQPSRTSAGAPVYRRFSTYEQRIRSRSTDLSVASIQSYDMRTPGRTARAKSAPVPLEIRDLHNRWSRVQETEKGKGKKRIPDPDVSTAPILESVEFRDAEYDHIAPFRPRSPFRHQSAASTSSFAGPSQSVSGSRVELHHSAFPLSPQLYTVKEDEECTAPKSFAYPTELQPLSVSTIEGKAAEPTGLITPVSSPCSSKRVSFSPKADKVMHYLDQTQELPPPLHQSSWGGFLLPSKPRVIARPPLARLSSLPSVRGQAAGRSILKRTTSMSDCTGDVVPELSLDGVPIHDKVSIPSLRRSSSRASMVGSERASVPAEAYIDCVAIAEAATFEDVDLSDVTLVAEQKQNPATSLGSQLKLPSLTWTKDTRAVKHWSMEGSIWLRRSGVYVNGFMSKKEDFPLVVA